jgi:predicted nucleotidyltransferase
LAVIDMSNGIDLIERNLEAIRALAREYGVARLEVFGSATSDEFDPGRSDIDFLIEYLPNTDLGPWIKRYFELQERLEALLGRPVDLVMAGALRNKYFIRSVNETRQLLYAA